MNYFLTRYSVADLRHMMWSATTRAFGNTEKPYAAVSGHRTTTHQCLSKPRWGVGWILPWARPGSTWKPRVPRLATTTPWRVRQEKKWGKKQKQAKKMKNDTVRSEEHIYSRVHHFLWNTSANRQQKKTKENSDMQYIYMYMYVCVKAKRHARGRPWHAEIHQQKTRAKTIRANKCKATQFTDTNTQAAHVWSGKLNDSRSAGTEMWRRRTNMNRTDNTTRHHTTESWRSIASSPPIFRRVKEQEKTGLVGGGGGARNR